MIKLENVSRIYEMGDEKVAALSDINIQVKDGEFVAVIGPSGSGKTTLLNIIGGLDTPTKGRVIIGDWDINELKDKQKSYFRNQTIGFVFQSFNLMPFYTALENATMPLLWSHKGLKGGEDRAKEILKLVGLGDRIKFYPTQLSSGQRQRVSIARAIVNKPKLILADEPTGNLDSKTGQEIINLLKQINKEAGSTLIIITHDASISKEAGRVIKLMDGKIV